MTGELAAVCTRDPNALQQHQSVVMSKNEEFYKNGDLATSGIAGHRSSVTRRCRHVGG